MDTRAAEVAISSLMQRARAYDGRDPAEAAHEREQALALAEVFGEPHHIAEVCGALCWSETVRYGAPVTERFLRRGIEIGKSTGLYVPQFLEFEALHFMEQGDFAGAEQRFIEALHIDGPNVASVHAGLGTLRLRTGRFTDARHSFALSLSAHGPDSSDASARLRALDGQAEAERYAGDDPAAAASLSRMLELTESYEASRTVRRYRTRALNGLGLVRWRMGDGEEALRAFRRALDLWDDDRDRRRTAEVFIALERHQALRYTVGSPPPVESSPGDAWAVGYLRLGRDAMTPGHLPASPPSPERVRQLRGLECGQALDLELRASIGDQVGRAWFVSGVRELRAERCVLVELVPNEGVAPRAGGLNAAVSSGVE